MNRLSFLFIWLMGFPGGHQQREFNANPITEQTVPKMIFNCLYVMCCVSQISAFDVLGDFFRPRTTESPTSADYGCEMTEKSIQIEPRIIGGSRVRDTKNVPYIAAIGERGDNETVDWFCGGSLIADRIVVTAAHCLARRVDVVRLGATHLDVTPVSSQDLSVASWTVHPDYQSHQSYHDIAILRLATSVSLSRGVRPICLADGRQGRRDGEVTLVMGWGAQQLGETGSRTLHQVKVKVFNNDECDRVYSNLTAAATAFPRGITDGQLCAGDPEGGKDACRGDSGGPLVVEDTSGTSRLLGVVSSGAGCGAKAFPGVYTRISAYSTWIRKFLTSS